MQLTESEWQNRLTPEQYHVLREKGTEPPGTGNLLYNAKDGTYNCAACGQAIFAAEAKFTSSTPGLIGWPSFSVALPGAITVRTNLSHGISRDEVVCQRCGSHLGHYFEDPSSPNGSHYCVNSAALSFTERGSKT